MPLNELEQRNNNWLAAIVDSSEDAIISKSLTGIIATWNQAAEIMFGYTQTEAIGQHISLLIPEDRLSEEEMIISKLKKGERIEHFETIRLAKSGRQINISLSVSPVIDETGIIGASKIARDITRQKEAEEIIKKYASQLEIINSVSKAIAADLDENDILQKVTDATTELCGAAFGAFFYNTVNAIGQSYMLHTLSGFKKEDFDNFALPRNSDLFNNTISGRDIVRSDDIAKDTRFSKNNPHMGMPEGNLPVVSFMSVPVISQSGNVIGALFYGHPLAAVFKPTHEDIIGAIAAQAAIALDNAKLYQDIKKLNNRKDEFIGFASHELKTPLAIIAGYVQLAQQSSELLPSFLPKIHKQVNKLNGIISDLLDISKIEASKLNINFAPVNLRTFVIETTESIAQISPTHTITCELPKEEVTVNIDAQKMGQVLTNLLNNAIKYSPGNNKVLFTVVILGDEVQISIHDWGIGIAENEVEKIFSRYYRIPESRTKADGLGVGLFIAQEIMDAHRGKIWVESKPGEGSVFHISFPFNNNRNK